MSNVVPLLKRDYFPKWAHEEPTKRPFRIYGARVLDRSGKESARARGDLPGRRYATTLRAHDQALLLVRWEPEGTVYEVYDVRDGDLIGVYRRVRVNGKQSVEFQVLRGGRRR